jgi:hypothetical protein
VISAQVTSKFSSLHIYMSEYTYNTVKELSALVIVKNALALQCDNI